MNSSVIDDFIRLVQMDLKRSVRSGAAVTREAIVAAVDKAVHWDEEFSAISTDDVIRLMMDRYAVWVGESKALDGDDDHVPWLTPERKRAWRYWPDYEEYLTPKMAETSVRSLDYQTDEILKRLEDPARTGAWDRRGLVVGHVQSGKTSNYTGLICKAADAGYKIIIVLAGLHNNLRSQTQLRLDEGFLGYETSPNHDAPKKEIGVGIGREPSLRPNYVTNRADNGDFRTAVAKHLGIRPEQTPWLFVVKKNKTVLTRLLEWIRLHVADQIDPDTGRRVVATLPLLLIDDEADHASVDTAEQEFDGDGNPDPEHEPKVINSLIRQILGAFSRCAYVGYTATPFANIFIHEKGRTALEGEDLFPRSFIINLPAPSNYVGPVKVFGHTRADGEVEGMPLIRQVDDFTDDHQASSGNGWMPNGHKNGHVPLSHGSPELPESLKEAIRSFILGCAIRRVRGQGKEHCSMLIHVTRFTSVQAEVTRQVRLYVEEIYRRLRRDIGKDDLLDDFRTLLDSDFTPTTNEVNSRVHPDERVAVCPWEAVEPELLPVVEELQGHVRAINGSAKDVLDYAENETTGIRVIAIGGDKLARGLTLEGLTVSYFLRASRMYDTLMQMGRWFGYRPGYLDLSRLYITDELEKWFRHITVAAEELRQAFDHMSATLAKPREYGLRVQSHEVMTVTSPAKMRHGREVKMSYAGDGVETTVLYRDAHTLKSNSYAVDRLVAGLGKPITDHAQERPGGTLSSWDGSLVWNNVPGETVAAFLASYKTHDVAYKANSTLLSRYVEEMLAIGELTSWSIAVLSGDSKPHWIAGVQMGLVKRTPDKRAENQEALGRYVIRRLLSPRDEAIDLDTNAYEAALKLTQTANANDPARGSKEREKKVPTEPSGPAIRSVRGLGSADGLVPACPQKAVLLIYPLDASVAGLGETSSPVYAIGVSFPASGKAKSVPYVVTNTYWTQELGSTT